jgi:hypothetical protein
MISTVAAGGQAITSRPSLRQKYQQYLVLSRFQKLQRQEICF